MIKLRECLGFLLFDLFYFIFFSFWYFSLSFYFISYTLFAFYGNNLKCVLNFVLLLFWFSCVISLLSCWYCLNYTQYMFNVAKVVVCFYCSCCCWRKECHTLCCCRWIIFFFFFFLSTSTLNTSTYT